MSSLREWLDEQTLQEETVTVRGRDLLVVEIDLAERGEMLAKYASKGDLTNQKAEGLMLSRCVLDPATREQIVSCDDWEYWSKKGTSFTRLLERVLVLNGWKDHAIDEQVKNSDTTQV